MTDRGWMYTGRRHARDIDIEWIRKADEFMDFAFANMDAPALP